jgi:hypothetical protein
MDWLAALRFPFALDYGEGIVWQQAQLIPGPRAYAPMSEDLPFIVFHYPPFYHLLVRAAWAALPLLDQLQAGRVVAMACSALIAPSIALLVLAATRRRGDPVRPLDLSIAVAVGLLPLCLNALRNWGMVMRVDIPSILLPLLAILWATYADRRFWGLVGALSLCLLAVFTKQTAVTAGVAVFLVALWRHPRNALGAAALVGAAGLAIVAWLQAVTSGGFLWNIVAANVNRFSVWYAITALRPEWPSAPVFLLGFVAGAAVLVALFPHWRDGWRGLARDLSDLRRSDRRGACRTMLLAYFAGSGLSLLSLLKFGAYFNYVLVWLPVACAVLGVWLVDLARAGILARSCLALCLLVLTATVARQPFREVADHPDLSWREAAVTRIATASKPVASDDMVLLLRAGKQVMFEPAITADLTHQGRWDDRRLRDFVHENGFAFILLSDDGQGASVLRTAGLGAAFRAAYPRVERLGPNLWIRLPPE